MVHLADRSGGQATKSWSEGNQQMYNQKSSRGSELTMGLLGGPRQRNATVVETKEGK